MKNRPRNELVGERVSGGVLSVATFLGGVCAGGLLMALLFMMQPARSPEVVRLQARPAETPMQTAGETEPASTVWQEPLGSIGPAGLEQGGQLVPLQSRSVGPTSKWRSAGGSCPLLLVGGLLGGCLLGAGAMAWSNRQATARLEARVLHFEHMASRHADQEDWLMELDKNLEGEWEDRR